MHYSTDTNSHYKIHAGATTYVYTGTTSNTKIEQSGMKTEQAAWRHEDYFKFNLKFKIVNEYVIKTCLISEHMSPAHLIEIDMCKEILDFGYLEIQILIG